MTIPTRIPPAAGMTLLAGLFLAGCVGETFDKGYVPSANALQQVTVGAPREQVLLALGTPSTTADFGGEVLYYISQKTRRPVAFMGTHLIDQKVLAVYLDDRKTVTRIANYTLQDGVIVDTVTRTTPTSGKDFSFVSQLFAATGNFAF